MFLLQLLSENLGCLPIFLGCGNIDFNIRHAFCRQAPQLEVRVVLDERGCKLRAEKVRQLHEGHCFGFGTHEPDFGVKLVSLVAALMEHLLRLGIQRMCPIDVGEECKVICLGKNGLRVIGGNGLDGGYSSMPPREEYPNSRDPSNHK